MQVVLEFPASKDCDAFLIALRSQAPQVRLLPEIVLDDDASVTMDENDKDVATGTHNEQKGTTSAPAKEVAQEKESERSNLRIEAVDKVTRDYER